MTGEESSFKIASFFLLLFFAVYFVYSPCPLAEDPGEEVLAIVNGEKIRKEQLIERAQIKHVLFVLRKAPLFSEFLMSNEEGKEALSDYKRYVLEKIINETLKLQKAKEMGLEVTKEEIKKGLREYIKYSTEVSEMDELKERLEKNERTMSDLKKEVRKNLLFEKLKRKVTKDLRVSKEEKKNYYRKNKNSFRDKDEEIKEFEEVEDQIEELLREQKVDNYWRNWIEKIKDESSIIVKMEQ